MAKRKISIDVDVKPELTGIRKLRQEFKDVKDELADALSMENVDTDKITELTEKAAGFKDQLADINEQVDVFATGSKYEAVSNSLGSIGSGLKSLDFGKASERALAFAASAKKISFKDVMGSFKDLGKTFKTVGKSILSNPFFILGAVITLIVIGIYQLLDSMGLIPKLLDILMAPLNMLIAGLKSLTDWLGLTSFAAQEAAEKKAKAFEDAAKKQELAQASIVQGLSNEIRMAKLAGKETVDLERAKLRELRKTADARAAADKAAYEAGLLNNKLSKQEILDLKEKAVLSRLAAGQAYEDIKFFDAQIAKDKQDGVKKDAELEAKKIEDDKAKRQAAYKQRLANEKTFNDNRLKAERAIEDLKTAAIKDDTERAIEENRIKYERLIADTLSNERLLQTEKDNLMILFGEEAKIKEDAIRDKQRLEDEADNKAKLEKLTEQYNSYLYNLVTDEKLIKERALQEELDKLKEFREAGLITEEEFNNRKKDAEKKLQDDLEATEKERIDKIAKLEEEALEKKKKQFADGVANMSSSISAISNLMKTAQEAELNRAEGNEEAQEAIRKKSFEKNKKMQIAMAIMGMAQGIIAGLGAPFPMNMVLPVIAGATGVANIAKIKSSQYQGGSSSPASSSSSSSSSPAGRSMPTATFMGSGNNQNTVSAGGGQSSINLNVNATVSETEMTSVQNRNRQREINAEL